MCTLTPSLIEIEGTPQQIEGPYFVDDMPNRSDIRVDSSNGSVQEGIPLRLIFHVYDVMIQTEMALVPVFLSKTRR
jgi:hypothetical protein